MPIMGHIKMGRGSKYFKEIERLLEVGYEPKHIMKLTNIPKSTVYRIVEKLQTDARYTFKRTMSHDYLWQFQMTQGNYSKSIQEINEEKDAMNKKYDSHEYMVMEQMEDAKPMVKAQLMQTLVTIQSNRTNETVKLLSQRDKSTDNKARMFNQGPVVNAIHEWVNSSPPAMGEQPHIPEIDELREDKKEPPKLNKIENKQDDIENDDDEELRIQQEMMKDEEVDK